MESFDGSGAGAGDLQNWLTSIDDTLDKVEDPDHVYTLSDLQALTKSDAGLKRADTLFKSLFKNP